MLYSVLFGLITAVLLGLILCYAVFRYGSPLNSPPSSEDLVKLQRIFSDHPERLRLGMLRTRLQGSTESFYIGSKEHLLAIQTHLKTFLRSRSTNLSATNTVQKFSSNRSNNTYILYLVVIFFSYSFFWYFTGVQFAWIYILFFISSVARDFFITCGRISGDGVVLGRRPFQLLIPYSALTEVRIEIIAEQGFSLDCLSSGGSFRVTNTKLAKLVTLYDLVISNRPDLAPTSDTSP